MGRRHAIAMKNVNWTRVLVILLVILSAYAVLYITGVVLDRFRHVIVIFVLGAMTAYVLTPLVNRLEGLVRVRWLAILASYVLLAAALAALSVFLFTPFIEQSQSLVDNLHTPSASSLQNMVTVQCGARVVERDLQNRTEAAICGGTLLPAGNGDRLGEDVASLQSALTALKNAVVSGYSRGHEPTHTPHGTLPPNPGPQTPVPPSYWKPIAVQVQSLATAVSNADTPAAVTAARKVQSLAHTRYTTMLNTPILLLRAQGWLDQHGIAIDVHDKFGQAAQQLSDQGSNLLDNAVAILQATANILLNLVLILIVAFYLLADGRRLIRSGIDLVPASYREQVWFFVSSLDGVLGGYIRGQLLLSALAGALGGAGAAVLGVPYPLLIGVLTFLLESIPVIGPLVALVPAVVVSLVFMPILTTILLFAWNMIFQQVVTNILGPRVMGIAVGIHPLEAMVAVLVGYPLAGFLGAFLAVPIAGVLHIVIREFYHYFVHGRALPTAVPDLQTVEDEESAAPRPRGARSAS
jgi:predicted PurR-regulated permease PerM